VRPERGYNAGMGANQTPEIDAWLRDGGVVITASDRAARAISSAYNRSRLAEGRKAWTAPAVTDWQRFAREEWERRSTDARLVLNPIQERAIWVEIVAAGGHAAATLPESRHRLAAMAMEAHSLLGSYAPRLLDGRARVGWANDAAAFSHWLTSFDDSCDAASAVGASCVGLELIPLLRRDTGSRPPLLLAGFDRLLPVQHAFFEAWGDWRLVGGSAQAKATFYAAQDAESELAACTLACNARLSKQPGMRLLVVTQDAATRRGEIERAFLHQHGGASPAPFEFSLGVPLGGVAIARSAMLLLRWLAGAIEEHHADWLFGTRYSTKTAEEASALQAFMRDLRRHGLQRTHWTLEAFLQQRANPALPASWLERMTAAQRRMRAARQKNRGPLEWAELTPLLLSDIGWPGPTLGSSAEFQAAQRLQHVIEQCSSLGFDGRLIEWHDFLAELERALAETLFSPESLDSPILIAGPAESAGLTADAIWFLGASEDGWPTRGSLHPLIPAAVQRQALMPHASPQLDWELADAITRRLSASAPEICFSYAQQVGGVDGRPSRIVTQLAGPPEPLPLNLVRRPAATPLTICVEDQGLISLLDPDTAERDLPLKIRGGSKVLTAQSQCAFKGFAIGRLGAETWDPAEAGLSPSVRGQLLHAVMHAIWAGPPLGIHSLDQLHRIPDRRAFVAGHVDTALQHELPAAARELMPLRYLELEAQRLTRIVAEWLDYEGSRLPFTVMGTELNTETTVGNLSFGLRLDRIDQLKDGSLLVIDYKTGDVSQKSWDLPRPDDVQLPLYGGFALGPGRELGGLVFARIRAGDVCFAGRVGDVEGTLGSGLNSYSSLKRNELKIEHLLDWRDAIEQLARDYVAGRADVNPRDPPKTCSRCGLHTLCRIHERPVDAQELEAQEEDAGEADE
jgi:ATP-dependent helicase/nuclease subunit B